MRECVKLFAVPASFSFYVFYLGLSVISAKEIMLMPRLSAGLIKNCGLIIMKFLKLFEFLRASAIMISSPHDSPFILVLCIPRSSRNSDGVTPCGGAKYRWGIKFARFSINKSLYLANDTRYRHGCYGTQIGNHTQAFEWHQFQRPWVISKPVFKVTILFNVK